LRTRAIHAALSGMKRRSLLVAPLLATLLTPPTTRARTAPAASAATAGGGVSREFLRRYRAVRFANHERLFLWWLRATKYGIVGAEVRALYNMEVCSLMRCQNGSDDAFTVRSVEMVYNTDLDSGALLTTWRNPYTDESLAAPSPKPLGPTTLGFSSAGPQLPNSLPGAELTHEHAWGAIDTLDDEVVLRDESHSLVRFPNTGAPDFRVSDLSYYRARQEDLRRPQRGQVAATVMFNAVSNWQRWVGMQNRPGVMLSRGFGRKAARLDALPRPFLRLLEQHHPEIARVPESALALEPQKFER
jgi:hypothetical protein